MNDTYLVPVYLVYLAVSVTLVVWLARTLFRNGSVFLEDIFDDKPHMAQAVNKLLVIGFYMLNLGYAALLLKAEEAPTAVAAVEVLGRKLGILLLSLAVLHFVNMYVFYRIRRAATAEALPPPPPPPPAPAGPQQAWAPTR
ncbi:MAG: hypothetical protein ACR2K0_08935 [Acidimicrobiales bacterium]